MTVHVPPTGPGTGDGGRPGPQYVEVTPETCGVADDLVAQALYALSLFGTCTLREAKILLSMWARRDQLTDEQVDEVLAYYQPVPSMAPPIRWSVTPAGVEATR